MIGFVGLTLLVGIADGVLAAPAMHGWYGTLRRPPATPPDWLFAPVWIALYVMIAVAAWLVWQKPGSRLAMLRWGWLLLANAAWTPLFFTFHLPWLALLDLLAVVFLAGTTAHRFARHARPAGWLMLPYLLWTCYAAALNAGFALLNPG